MIVCHVLFTLALLLTHKSAQQVSSTKILSADMSAYMSGDKSTWLDMRQLFDLVNTKFYAH